VCFLAEMPFKLVTSQPLSIHLPAHSPALLLVLGDIHAIAQALLV
jgi:hypothetical protein